MMFDAVTDTPEATVTMSGPHTMDLIIFGAGLLGVITLAIHLGYSLPKYAQYVQESNDHYAAGEPENNIGMDPIYDTIQGQFCASSFFTSLRTVVFLHGFAIAPGVCRDNIFGHFHVLIIIYLNT